MYTGLLFALAILFLSLIPLAPKLVRLRIRFFRWIHWNWLGAILSDNPICDRGNPVLCRLGVSVIDPSIGLARGCICNRPATRVCSRRGTV